MQKPISEFMLIIKWKFNDFTSTSRLYPLFAFEVNNGVSSRLTYKKNRKALFCCDNIRESKKNNTGKKARP